MGDEDVVERALVEAVVLFGGAADGGIGAGLDGGGRGWARGRGPWLSSARWRAGLRACRRRPTSSSIEREAERGHDLPGLLGDHEEVVDHVLGLPGEAGAEHRVLRGDADGAGVEVALAHHDAAKRDQRRRGEAEFFGAQDRGDHDIATGLELAVGFQPHARAQVVEHQRLVRLSDAQFPGNAGVLDARQRGSACAAVVAGDEDVVGVRLGDARGDGANADLGDQLDADARLGVGVLEVVDQLGQILDGVDVVVGRRTDEHDARDGVADAGDVIGDFVAGELAAFAGLGALGHFDLELVGVGQVVGGGGSSDAEPPGGDLLDGGAFAESPLGKGMKRS